jgi:iron complex transport system permease protein
VTAAAPFIGASTTPPFTGASVISPWGALTGTLTGADAVILWQMRVPRVLLAFLAGAGLAMSGMAFQALFRNPLATPFTLGVSSGASLGAAAYVTVGASLGALGAVGISAAAFAGAVLAIAIVYGLTRLKRGFSTATMLLAGVALSFFFSSLILFMQYAAGLTHSFRILRWLMGSLDATGYGSVLDVLPFVAGGSAIVLYLMHELNLLTTGEDIAASRGVNVDRAKKTVFLAVSLMVGGVVATCGPIGFVGMMVPHICRLLVGWEHRLLAPATLAFGGAFLVLCDCVSRTLEAPTVIPVGVITALLGGPFFLWLLLGGSSERGLLRGGRG